MATVSACPGFPVQERIDLCKRDQRAVKSVIGGATPKINRTPVGS
jgi:hypothetical protein